MLNITKMRCHYLRLNFIIELRNRQRLLGKDRVNGTVGSALDLYGGDLAYEDVVEFCRHS